MGVIRDHWGQHRRCTSCHTARVVHPMTPDSELRESGLTEEEIHRIRRISPYNAERYGTARGGAPVTRSGGRTAFAPEILRRRRAETQACRGIPTEALEAGAIAALVTAARAMTLATPTNMAARVVALYDALAPWREVTP